MNTDTAWHKWHSHTENGSGVLIARIRRPTVIVLPARMSDNVSWMRSCMYIVYTYKIASNYTTILYTQFVIAHHSYNTYSLTTYNYCVINYYLVIKMISGSVNLINNIIYFNIVRKIKNEQLKIKLTKRFLLVTVFIIISIYSVDRVFRQFYSTSPLSLLYFYSYKRPLSYRYRQL